MLIKAENHSVFYDVQVDTTMQVKFGNVGKILEWTIK